MNPLGIYFGPKCISLCQLQGKKDLAIAQIPRELISPVDTEEKVPEEVKLVALFKDEFRKNKFAGDKVAIVLSGNDLVIRTFEMPVLPQDELNSAVNFEAKKYVPFKLEDLFLDFQISFDKVSRKNSVLLVGIKKETLSRYSSIFEQLNVSIVSLEYSAFSVYRLFKLAALKEKGAVALIGADLNEEDEVNFTVLQNGFPLFSRDIILTGNVTAEANAPDAILSVKEEASGTMSDKLKAELRASFDFYKRKFPAKNIEKVYMLVNENYRIELESFLKERDLSCVVVDPKKISEGRIPFSLSNFKAYSGAISKNVKTGIKIDLLSVRAKFKSVTSQPQAPTVAFEPQVLLQGLRVDSRAIVWGLLLCIGVYGYAYYQKFPLQSSLSDILAQRPQVKLIKGEVQFNDLTALSAKLEEKVKSLDGLLKNQIYLTEELNAIPKYIPSGMWLTSFAFSKNPASGEVKLVLQGMVYLGDNDKELEAVNSFLSNLKDDIYFSAHFKKISIDAVEDAQLEKTKVTKFSLGCSST